MIFECLTNGKIFFMKKIILTLALVLAFTEFTFAANNDEYSKFMASLKLTKAQQERIDNIEKKYNRELAQLRANVILRGMRSAKAGINYKSGMLDSEFSALNDEIAELQLQKEDEIASCLGLIKRIKYRRYCNNHRD